MPWYPIPFNINERVRRAITSTRSRTKIDEALLELLKCAAEDWVLLPVFAGERVHINFGRDNRKAARPCVVCGWFSERECDWIVNDALLIHGKPKTCDAPMCAYCTFSPAPEKDICPAHVGPLKAWLAGRTNSTDGAGP